MLLDRPFPLLDRPLALWRRVTATVRRWITRAPVLDVAPDLDTPTALDDALDDPVVLDAPPEPSRVPASAIRDGAAPDWGDGASSVRWDFRDDILDRLAGYFRCLRRLRAHDRDGYDLGSRVGFVVSDWFVNPQRKEFRAGFRERPGPLPMFAGVLMVHDAAEGDKVPPSFVYAQKIRSPRVAPFDGDVYRLSVLFDTNRSRQSLAALCSCHVGVGADRSVSLLRERGAVTHTIRTGRTRGRRSEVVTLREPTWTIPAWMTGDFDDVDWFDDPETYARNMFGMTMDTYLEATDRIVVHAIDGPVRAAFGIDLSRAPRFFADRDATAVATDGRRRRIFHAVTEHRRALVGNRTTTVRAHYRGIRDFTWNGYGIHVGTAGPVGGVPEVRRRGARRRTGSVPRSPRRRGSRRHSPGLSRAVTIMPTGPGRTCGWPGCPRRTFDRDALCDVHRMQREARRGSARERGYDDAWEAIRVVVLREEPFCRLCLAAGRRSASEHVDHVRPIRNGGTHARANLRGLCATCHNRRTATEQSPGWRR